MRNNNSVQKIHANLFFSGAKEKKETKQVIKELYLN